MGIKTKVTITEYYELDEHNVIPTQSLSVTKTTGPSTDNGPGPLGESS